jgi:hypothetical protein
VLETPRHSFQLPNVRRGLVVCVARIAELAPDGRVYGENRRRSRTGCAGADRFMSDNAVWFVLLQAFNTETTKNHGAALDEKSP